MIVGFLPVPDLFGTVMFPKVIANDHQIAYILTTPAIKDNPASGLGIVHADTEEHPLDQTEYYNNITPLGGITDLIYSYDYTYDPNEQLLTVAVLRIVGGISQLSVFPFKAERENFSAITNSTPASENFTFPATRGTFIRVFRIKPYFILVSTTDSVGKHHLFKFFFDIASLNLRHLDTIEVPTPIFDLKALSGSQYRMNIAMLGFLKEGDNMWLTFSTFKSSETSKCFGIVTNSSFCSQECAYGFRYHDFNACDSCPYYIEYDAPTPGNHGTCINTCDRADSKKVCYSDCNMPGYKHSCTTSTCEEGFELDSTGISCIPKCKEEGMFYYEGECMDGCPAGSHFHQSLSAGNVCSVCTGTSWYEFNHNCVQACPPGYNYDSKTNICSICPLLTYSYATSCLAQCTTSTTLALVKDKRQPRCVNCAADGNFNHSGNCVSNCEGNAFAMNSIKFCHNCYLNTDGTVNVNLTDFKCYSTCPDKTGLSNYQTCNICTAYSYSGNCVSSCPEYLFQDITNKKCTNCKDSKTFLYNKKCEKTAPTSGAELVDATYNFYKSCKDLKKYLSNKKCVAECPKGTAPTTANECIDYNAKNKVLHEGKALDKCPTGFSALPDRKCYSCRELNLLKDSNGTCTKTCSNGYHPDKNECKKCEALKMRKYDNKCYQECPPGTAPYGSTVCIQCKTMKQVWHQGKCVQTCPEGFFKDTNSEKCINCLLNKDKLEYNGTCVARCPSGFKADFETLKCKLKCSCLSGNCSWVSKGCVCKKGFYGAECDYSEASNSAFLDSLEENDFTLTESKLETIKRYYYYFLGKDTHFKDKYLSFVQEVINKHPEGTKTDILLEFVSFYVGVVKEAAGRELLPKEELVRVTENMRVKISSNIRLSKATRKLFSTDILSRGVRKDFDLLNIDFSPLSEYLSGYYFSQFTDVNYVDVYPFYHQLRDNKDIKDFNYLTVNWKIDVNLNFSSFSNLNSTSSVTDFTLFDSENKEIEPNQPVSLLSFPPLTANLNFTHYTEVWSNEKESIFDYNSLFFNDRCFIYRNSTSRTDIPLTQRKRDFYHGKAIYCSEGCKFGGFKYNTLIKCDCPAVKQSFSAITTDSFASDRGMNLDLVKCWKVALKLPWMLANGGFISGLVLLLCCIGTSIGFHFFRKQSVEEDKEEILFNDLFSLERPKTIKIKMNPNLRAENTVDVERNNVIELQERTNRDIDGLSDVESVHIEDMKTRIIKFKNKGEEEEKTEKENNNFIFNHEMSAKSKENKDEEQVERVGTRPKGRSRRVTESSDNLTEEDAEFMKAIERGDFDDVLVNDADNEDEEEDETLNIGGLTLKDINSMKIESSLLNDDRDVDRYLGDLVCYSHVVFYCLNMKSLIYPQFVRVILFFLDISVILGINAAVMWDKTVEARNTTEWDAVKC